MAYAVLASLFTTTHKMLNPYPLIIPCKKQTIQSLHENIDSLISFIDNIPPHKYQTTKSLEANIRDVGHKAEDILDSYISKHSRSIYKLNEDDEVVETDGDDQNDEDDKNAIMLSQSLVEIMKGFESLMQEMKEIQISANFGGVPVEQMNSLSVAGSSNPTSSGKNKFVLLDGDLMKQIKEQLFYGEKQVKVIPITGMGGIGKTTLAKNLIADRFTSRHFDIRGWVTVSQQYSIQDVVEKLLKDITGEDREYTNLSESTEQLHKTMYRRMYVVVLDDLWDTDACNELLNLFPECNNGSRIMVTTRQSGVATFAAKSNYYHQMKLLNGDTSWDLLRQVIFPQEGNMNCPMELMEIGKDIAMKCNGLPLTISVIGGLLSKGEMTREQWEHVAQNMKSVLNEEGDQYSEILSLSYNYLPHRLKACFLYLGVYPEDFEIVVSELLQLWIVEGFLKPGPTDMEEVAMEKLDELIKRNLILVEKVGRSGRTKSSKIHDLLRDLCMREARREKFFYVWNEHTGFNREETKVHRRLSILPSYKKPEGEFDMKKSMPGIRSLMVFAENSITLKSKFELVRVLKHHFSHELIYQISEMSNLRWIEPTDLEYSSSLFNLCDLQYLIISPNYIGKRDLPLCIWFMPQLRQIKASFRMVMRERDVCLPRLPPKTKNPCVLKRLQVLYGIKNFRCDDEVPERIPNLKKLKIFNFEDEHIDWSYYLLNNLANMSKLETLHCELHCSSRDIIVGNILFPISLKSLTLLGSKISWEHMDQIIGVLPNLVILRLIRDASVGRTWRTSEDHFKKLEYLMIQDCYLKEWIVEDSNHFPSLRLIYIKSCGGLKEIPICIGEIPTLEAIELVYCSKGVCSSGKTIQDDYNNDIKLIIGQKTRYANEEDDNDDEEDGNEKEYEYEYEDNDEDDNEDEDEDGDENEDEEE